MDNECLVQQNADTNLKLKSVLKDKKCNTCALGAAFVCAVDRFDKLKIQDLKYNSYYDDIVSLSDDDMYSYLTKFFTKSQLNLMEIAFELGDGFNNYPLSFEQAHIVKWAKQYKNVSERLRAIMLNVIRNKGTFIAPKRLPSRR